MDGVAESLTWLQLRRRVLNVAHELQLCGLPGDRAVILAPQSLDYIVAFLGALQDSIIAVPLSVPLGGVADERVDSVLRDAAPAVVLMTSGMEQLVVVAEVKKRGSSAEDAAHQFAAVKREAALAISVFPRTRHCRSGAGITWSIPITTSGKLRRAACVEQYQRDEFDRLD